MPFDLVVRPRARLPVALPPSLPRPAPQNKEIQSPSNSLPPPGAEIRSILRGATGDLSSLAALRVYDPTLTAARLSPRPGSLQNGRFIPDKSNIWRDSCDGYYDWVKEHINEVGRLGTMRQGLRPSVPGCCTRRWVATALVA